MIPRALANRIWKFSCRRNWRAFQRARRHPRRTQEALLLDFLQRNADSHYGRHCGYRDIKSIEQFQSRVPIVTYDQLAPWIDRIIHGEQGVLTTEPVQMFEKTSGSSDAAKYIPYTRSLRREFQRGIDAWMYDLFLHRPALLNGSHYWSISPLARRRETTPGGLPVGIEDDAEYLGPLARRVMRSVMAVPNSVANSATVEQCRAATIEHLLRRRDLRLISVWHPSFLSLLMSALPAGLSPADCWPELALVSCWTSAAAARFLAEFERLFPHVEIQGKGLLATEGVVSIPQIGSPAPMPAITSHFLEFIDESGRPHLADELQICRQYEVVITTGAGLARYALGDIVKVTLSDCIEFVGRGASTSDICGEKLSEAFVGRVLREVAEEFGHDGFMMLAPHWDAPPRYVLLIESPRAPDFAAEVERRLRTSVHYVYCRQLGQLAAVEGVSVHDGDVAYLRESEKLGMKLGDIKPTYLRSDHGWRERMTETKEAAHVG